MAASSLTPGVAPAAPGLMPMSTAQVGDWSPPKTVGYKQHGEFLLKGAKNQNYMGDCLLLFLLFVCMYACPIIFMMICVMICKGHVYDKLHDISLTHIHAYIIYVYIYTLLYV